MTGACKWSHNEADGRADACRRCSAARPSATTAHGANGEQESARECLFLLLGNNKICARERVPLVVVCAALASFACSLCNEAHDCAATSCSRAAAPPPLPSSAPLRVAERCRPTTVNQLLWQPSRGSRSSPGPLVSNRLTALGAEVVFVPTTTTRPSRVRDDGTGQAIS